MAPLSGGDTLVVVGAGLAGLRVVEGARGAGFAGRVVLVGDEPHAPYDRPPLSKAVLAGDGHDCRLDLLPEAELAALEVELKLGRAAVALDRRGRTITLAGGEVVAYDRLVIATGSAVRTLPGLEAGRPGVCYLRSLDDALALRQALASARRVAIVGAGVIGLEVAAAAAKPGRAVTVIEAEARVMARAAAAPITEFIAGRHRQAGVDLRLGTRVSEVEDDGDGRLLTLSDGRSLACDLVVVGVGVAPNDRLAREGGLEVAPGGVVVDGYGMTSDPAIYAAGEVAMHFNALHGRHDRQETWAHAAAHGEHVGRSLARPGAPYDDLGSYWTDQYDFTVTVLGSPTGEVDVVRGDPADGTFIVFHLTGGKVVGVSGVNAARDLRAAKALVGAERLFDPADLADRAKALKSLA